MLHLESFIEKKIKKKVQLLFIPEEKKERIIKIAS